MNNRQYYFKYNGKQYPTGTILKVDPFYTHGKELVVFEWVAPSNRWYEIKGLGWYPEEVFYDMIIEVTDEIDSEYVEYRKMEILKSELTLEKELNIDGLGLMWAWYIFLMAITSFFVNNFVYWIIITIMFYVARVNKLVTYGYKKINGKWYKINI